MTLSLRLDGRSYGLDLAHPIDLSFRTRFDSRQPRLFGAPPAEATPFRVGAFVGDVRLGGSVNVDSVRFAPHLHGTHTECVGHLTSERIAVDDVWSPGLRTASLVTVETTERQKDRMVTAESMRAALRKTASDGALILRVRPAESGYPLCDFELRMPPYLSTDAMKLIVDAGFDHLLVDLPSVDRLQDGGALAAHRVFFDDADPGCRRTITELIVVPDDVPDGRFVLDLQTVSLELDAVPSRPVLYSLLSP